MATTKNNTRIVRLTATAAEVDQAIGGKLREIGLLPVDFVVTDLKIEPDWSEGLYSIVCIESIDNA